MGWCGPRVCASAHVLWSLAYIACGAVQLVVGVFFLVALPFLQLGSNVWTGAWNVVAGVSGALLACAGPLSSPARHETLLYLAVSVLVANIVNLVLLEGLEWRQPAAASQLMQPEQTRGRLLMYARWSTDAAALVASAAALLDSQFTFCSLQAARSRRRRRCRQCRLLRSDKLAPAGCVHAHGGMVGPDSDGVEYVRVRSSTTPAGKVQEHYPPSWVFAAEQNSYSHADNCRDAAEASAAGRRGQGQGQGQGKGQLSNGCGPNRQLPSAPPSSTPTADRTKQGSGTPRNRSEPQQLQVVVDSPTSGNSRHNGGPQVSLQTFSRTGSPGTSTATSPAMTPAASPAPPRLHQDRHVYEPVAVQRAQSSSSAAPSAGRHRESAHRESSHRESSHRESSHRESSHRESSHRESSHREGSRSKHSKSHKQEMSAAESACTTPSPSPRPPSSAMSESLDGSEPQQYASLMSELQHAFRAKKPAADSPASSTATADSTTLEATLEDAASSCSQRFTRELEEALQVIQDLESPGGTVAGSLSGGAPSSVGAPPPPVPDWKDSDSEDSQSGDSSKTLSGKPSSSGGYCSLERPSPKPPIGKPFACPTVPVTSCSTSGYNSPALDATLEATLTDKPRQKTVIDICDGTMTVREVNNNETGPPSPSPLVPPPPPPPPMVISSPASGLKLSALSGLPGLSGLSLLRRARTKNGYAPTLSEELQGAILQSESLVFLSSRELEARHDSRQREIEQRVQQKFYGQYHEDDLPYRDSNT